MRASMRRIDKTKAFVVPPGATSASLLVYSGPLEEICVTRLANEGATKDFR